MTQREMETRIAELEIALENLLELFEPEGTGYEIEVIDSSLEVPPDTEYTMYALLDKSSADVVESSEEILWGGKADAEEA